ncbi:arginine--tRNA ligase, partial [Candidatus Bathyarchaeota archaeon]|nr:arginine--tRNA ligase [Candidatus Bathyarchaeota archaeon]
PENILAKELVDKALKGQLQTLWRMNIFYNLLIWERHIVSSGLFDSAISSMQDKNPDACYKIESGGDKGCIVLDMSMFGEKYTQNKKPYKILTRSNGVSTYTGKDIAFQLWKFGEASGFFMYEEFVQQPNGKLLHSTNLPAEVAGEKRKDPKDGGENHTGNENDFGHADRAINVIGFEQKYPQQVVRSALKVLGYDHHYDNSAHLSFKHVWLPDQKFSGRKGTWIGFHADAAMDKAVKKARTIIKGQNPDLSADNRDSLAEIIGVGAIKFYLAKFDLEKEITINWDDLLNFEGDACPYVQYSCVRAGSILEKARERGIPIPAVDATINASMLDTPQERALYFIISQLPSKIREICQSLSINQAPLYALEVADKFNSFYHECPVLRDDVPDDLQVARLMLVQDTILVLNTLLERVLGIQVPVRM